MEYIEQDIKRILWWIVKIIYYSAWNYWRYRWLGWEDGIIRNCNKSSE